MKRFTLIFLLTLCWSIFLSVYATFLVIKESGQGCASTFCNSCVFIAFWPSILLKSKQSSNLFEIDSLFLNFLGWFILICLLVILIKFMKKMHEKNLNL